MKNKFNIALSIALFLAILVTSLAQASGVDVTVVNVTVPITTGAKLAGGADGNYNVAVSAPTVQDQTITFGVLENKTYGDADFEVSALASSGLPVSFTVLGSCSVLESTVHITGAGSCTITAQQAGNLSYNAAVDVSQSFNIAKAPVTATAGSGSATYDFMAHLPSKCTVTGAYTGDLTCENYPPYVIPNAGTTVITPSVTGTDMGNFDITLVNGSYTIDKAQVTVTAGSGSTIYDGATHSPSECVITGSTVNFICINTPESVGPNVGTTVITPFVTGPGMRNFDITLVNGSYTIDKAPVTATAGSGSATYDFMPHYPSKCVVTGVYTGDLTCENYFWFTPPSVGTYVFRPIVTGTNMDNFDITLVNGSYTIYKAPVTVTAGSGSTIYDGAMHSPSRCIIGMSVNFSCFNEPESVGPNAGTTVITPFVIGGGVGRYFDITLVNGSYTIDKADAKCTVTGYSTIYDGAVHTATGSCTGVLGESLSGLTLSGTTHTNVGSYIDTWNFTDVTGNYHNASGLVSNTILPWTLNGFYAPVDMNGVYNLVKGGSTVPLKFEVFASNELTSTSVVQSFVQTKIACDGATRVDDIQFSTTVAKTLRYDNTVGQFIQNWQPPKLPGACYRVTMTTLDGSSLVAFFNLK